MALDILTGSEPLRAVKVLSNGKRRFDPIEKDRLIDAAMKPGVSVARLALARGVNANQLRNWVKLRRNRQAQDTLTVVAGQETSAFVPVVAASPTARQPDMPARSSSAGMRLMASLPNGVRLELENVDERALCAMIEVWGGAMFRLADDLRVYLHRDPIDFRAGINSLAILVEQSMGLSPFERAVFVFCNRRRTRMKLLFFERSGFVLVLKALSEDRFRWPRREVPVVTLDTEQLRWLLDGIDLDAMVRHPVRQYEFVG